MLCCLKRKRCDYEEEPIRPVRKLHDNWARSSSDDNEWIWLGFEGEDAEEQTSSCSRSCSVDDNDELEEGEIVDVQHDVPLSERFYQLTICDMGDLTTSWYLIPRGIMHGSDIEHLLRVSKIMQEPSLSAVKKNFLFASLVLDDLLGKVTEDTLDDAKVQAFEQITKLSYESNMHYSILNCFRFDVCPISIPADKMLYFLHSHNLYTSFKSIGDIKIKEIPTIIYYPKTQ